jgi:hypothetical protein
MANRHRGEVEAVLDGRPRTLCLTLGALAELEAAFGAEDLVALAARFEEGRLSARDLTRIIAAGLRGAGEKVGEEEVATMRCDGGAAGYARIAAALLRATFGAEEAMAEEAGDGDRPR